MAVVEMRVVFCVCTPCSVVPYVPSISMRTTSDNEDGGSTSIPSVRTQKEIASQCRTPKDNCHSSNKFTCMRPLSSIHSKAQHYMEVSSQPSPWHPPLPPRNKPIVPIEYEAWWALEAVRHFGGEKGPCYWWEATLHSSSL